MTEIHRLCTLLLILFAFLLSGCGPKQLPGWGDSRPATTAPAAATGPAAQSAPAINPYPAQASGMTPPPPATAMPAAKVAILLPLSGQHAAIGQAMLQSAQLALFDLGFDSLELMPLDTKGSPDGAVQAASAALNNGAQLILGPLFAEEVKAVKGVTAPRNINVIAFSTDWSIAGGNTYLMGFMPFSQIERITQYAAAKGIRSAGIIAPQDTYGETATRLFEQKSAQSGIAITERFRFPPNSQDLTNRLKDFTHYDPAQDPHQDGGRPQVPYQAVFMPVGGSQGEMLATSLSYYGLRPDVVQKLGTGLWDDPRIAVQPQMQGAWFAAPSPRNRRMFEDKYRRAYGQTPPRLASLAYDAAALSIVLAKTGLQRNGRPSYDRPALTNPNGFAGMDGIFRFRANNLVERGLSVIEIRNRNFVEIDPAPRTFQQ